MNETEKAVLRKIQKCPYSSCDLCEIVHCPAKSKLVSCLEDVE